MKFVNLLITVVIGVLLLRWVMRGYSRLKESRVETYFYLVSEYVQDESGNLDFAFSKAVPQAGDELDFGAIWQADVPVAGDPVVIFGRFRNVNAIPPLEANCAPFRLPINVTDLLLTSRCVGGDPVNAASLYDVPIGETDRGSWLDFIAARHPAKLTAAQNALTTTMTRIDAVRALNLVFFPTADPFDEEAQIQAWAAARRAALAVITSAKL